MRKEIKDGASDPKAASARRSARKMEEEKQDLHSRTRIGDYDRSSLDNSKFDHTHLEYDFAEKEEKAN
jgi:hypothetical protein